VLSLSKLALLALLGLPLVGCVADLGTEDVAGEANDGAVASSQFQALVPELSASERLTFDEAHVAVYRSAIERAQQVMPALELAAQAQKPLLVVSAGGFSQGALQELGDLQNAGLVRVHALHMAGADTFARFVHVTAATVLETAAEHDAVTLEDLGYVRATLLESDAVRVVPGR
jgi:hypothetical protein